MSTISDLSSNSARGSRSSNQRKIPRPPGYCHHKTKGLAYIRLNGQFIYLGRYDSPESKSEYRRIVAEWMISGRTPKDLATDADLSVNELLLAYWRFAEGYYPLRSDGRAGELERIRYAIKTLKDLYGSGSINIGIA